MPTLMEYNLPIQIKLKALVFNKELIQKLDLVDKLVTTITVLRTEVSAQPNILALIRQEDACWEVKQTVERMGANKKILILSSAQIYIAFRKIDALRADSLNIYHFFLYLLDQDFEIYIPTKNNTLLQLNSASYYYQMQELIAVKHERAYQLAVQHGLVADRIRIIDSNEYWRIKKLLKTSVYNFISTSTIDEVLTITELDMLSLAYEEDEGFTFKWQHKELPVNSPILRHVRKYHYIGTREHNPHYAAVKYSLKHLIIKSDIENPNINETPLLSTLELKGFTQLKVPKSELAHLTMLVFNNSLISENQLLAFINKCPKLIRLELYHCSLYIQRFRGRLKILI